MYIYEHIFLEILQKSWEILDKFEEIKTYWRIFFENFRETFNKSRGNFWRF